MSISVNFGKPLRKWLPAVTVLAFGLPVLSGGAFAQKAPTAPQAPQATESRQEATPMRVVVVEWRIKKGREQEFLDY